MDKKTKLYWFRINLAALILGIICIPFYALWSLTMMIRNLFVFDGSEVTAWPWEWDWRWGDGEHLE